MDMRRISAVHIGVELKEAWPFLRLLGLNCADHRNAAGSCWRMRRGGPTINGLDHIGGMRVALCGTKIWPANDQVGSFFTLDLRRLHNAICGLPRCRS